MSEFEARLRSVDQTVLTPLVRRALANDTLEVVDWTCQPIRGGFAQTTVGAYGTYRFRGHARAHDRIVPWSLILKALGATSAGGSADPAEWNYWKREVLAYQSGLLDGLPGDFTAPGCFAVSEYPGNEFWIWLEDIAEAGGSVWPIERYGLAARHLGQFNGAYLLGHPLPIASWLTRGRIRNWLRIGEPVLRDLRTLREHPLARHWLTDAHVTRIERLWAEREQLLALLDRLPRSLCHHDAFRRNLFVRRGVDGRYQTVAIDWQMVGTGAIGEEIVPLVTASIRFLEVDMSNAQELDTIVFEGYLNGLRDAGWQGDAGMVRFGFAAATALFTGVGAVGLWLPAILDQKRRGMVEQTLGHPLDRILEQFAGLQRYALDLGDEARALIDKVN